MTPTFLAVAAFAVLCTAAAAGGIIWWEKRPPVRNGPPPTFRAQPTPPPTPGAFNISDPVHLLAILAVCVLVVLFLGVL